jgi:hypothetical protein
VSALDERSLDNLADMILNVMWQNLLEVFSVIRKKMDSEGPAAVKNAFENAERRILDGTLKDHIEVRWGMSLCPHCNDENVDKNGIAYPDPSGDGVEFNQCLNCRIGILYKLVVANATMEKYVIGLGSPDQFNGMSFFWDAIIPSEMNKFQPMYEIVSKGQWMGTVSFDDNKVPRFLPFENMKDYSSRGSEEGWTSDIPPDIKSAVDAFISIASEQIDVALVIK